MSESKNAFSITIIIVILILLFFSSNILRYIKFKHYCSGEAGLFVNEKIERNKGWLVEDEYYAKYFSKLEHTAYFRFKNKHSNELFDLRYVKGNPDDERSYSIMPAELGIQPTYKIIHSLQYYDDLKRLKKSSVEIVKISSGSTVASYSRIYYSAWGGALGGPDWEGCADPDAAYGGELNAFGKLFSE